MPLFIFDVNDGDSSEWDDEELECENRFEIEKHAILLLEEATVRMAARSAESLPATVVVYEEKGQIIMSAHGSLGGRVRVLWKQGSADAEPAP